MLTAPANGISTTSALPSAPLTASFRAGSSRRQCLSTERIKPERNRHASEYPHLRSRLSRRGRGLCALPPCRPSSSGQEPCECCAHRCQVRREAHRQADQREDLMFGLSSLYVKLIGG